MCVFRALIYLYISIYPCTHYINLLLLLTIWGLASPGVYKSRSHKTLCWINTTVELGSRAFLGEIVISFSQKDTSYESAESNSLAQLMKGLLWSAILLMPSSSQGHEEKT